MSAASPAPPPDSSPPGLPGRGLEVFADVLMLVLAAIGLGFLLVTLALDSRPAAAVHLWIWGGILAVGVLLWALGWLKLFGPLLFYDMLCSARRGRHVWMRGVYAALLLFLLLAASMGIRRYSEMSAVRAEARFAQEYFELFLSVQLAVVLVLTPAYVAGAISDEKDRKTLEFLLATDLRNREIVLSKLGARLANLVLFVLTGLPILSLLQFLGGVDPLLVQVGFAATALTMIGLGGVSILVSTYFKRPRDAVAVAYLFVAAYLTVSFLGFAAQLSRAAFLTTPVWFGSDPLTVNDLINGLNAGNLFLYFPQVAELGRRGQLDAELPRLLGQYALFHLPAAVLFTGWAVLRLRVVALKQMHGTGRRDRKARARPPVGSQPMLWKEVYAEGGIRFNWMAWLVVGILLAATLLPAVLIVVYHLGQPYRLRSEWDSLPGQINLWVRTAGAAVSALAGLAVAVRASTAYSGERDRQTLDSLLATPLDSTPILFAKWLGCILSVRLTWVWLAVIWAIAIALGGLHPVALPFLILAWLVFACFLATLGLWFSVLSRTSLRATLWTLMTTVGVTLGHWLPWTCCMFIPMLGDVSYIAKVQGGLTPPAAMFSLAFSGDELNSAYHGRDWWEMFGFSLFGVFAYAVATVLLWSGLTLRFRALTMREEYTRPERGWAPRPRPLVLDTAPLPVPVKPAPVEPRPTEGPPVGRAMEQPPPRLSGAKLIEERWEAPKPRSDGDGPRKT